MSEHKQESRPDQTLSAKENVIQFVKFGLFSASAGLIQFLTFTLLTEFTDLPYMFCYLPALVLSVLWNFTINRRFMFKSANNIPIAMLKVAAYYLVFTPLSTWWGKALTDAGWNGSVVEIGTMLINFITEFLFNRFVVYRGSMNTRDDAKKEKN